jgi:DEAD/DEAH box helicase domain-containing protein
MDVNEFLQYITGLPDYEGQIEHVQYLPSAEPTFADLKQTLHPSLESALRAQGFQRFFSHQALAIDAALAGENVMVSTSSASGKTICYNVPVLQSLLHDRGIRALYLFPTKALAQDQLRSLGELGRGLLAAGEYATFDGDTPQIDRGQIKKKARIVLSNPDMLHIGMLPNHKTWSFFFSNLKYVVLDEAHVYRGVFGSHVGNIMRRLKRICRMYGSSPQFMLCSATTGNPRKHAEKLAGEKFVLVDRDGAPHGRKSFIFWNAPLTDAEKSSRRSTNSEATFLFTELVKKNIRSLVFARSRKLTELIYVYSRDHLPPELGDRIKAYRAGYLAEDRRQIEQELFSGALLGVVSTNALELGIDIGDLEATIITGYPGSIASTWQQAGRSGRSGGGSLSVLIGDNNPLDQYLINHPDFFFGHPYEDALLNWENINILKEHLLCAAWERPLTESDRTFFGDSLPAALEELQREGRIRLQHRSWHLSPRLSHPAQHINIRSASANNYAILDTSRAYQVMETVQESNAFFQLHDGAVYLHQGETFFIKKLDIEKKIALAEPISVPYYTQAKDVTDISILRTLQQKQYGGVGVNFGEVEVTTSVLGFRKKMQFTEEVIGDEPLDLPPLRFVTQAVWFDIPQQSIATIIGGQLDFAGGLHAVEHASIALLPLFALCDRNDIGGVSTPFHADTGKAQIFIYDACPGGIGISEKGYHIILELWQATLNAIRQCPCLEGCPGCIQSPKCGNNNEPLDKKAALILLEGLLQAGTGEGE